MCKSVCVATGPAHHASVCLTQELEAFFTDPESDLLPLVERVASEKFADELAIRQRMFSASNFTQPHALYPIARLMRRKVIYHAGPTNSGELGSSTGTPAALQPLLTHSASPVATQLHTHTHTHT